MGGDHTYYIPPKSADEVQSAFRSSMDEVKQSSSSYDERTRNVFISFSVEDEAQVNFLRSQARDPDFELLFRDYSVKDPIEEKWKSEVRDRIAQTSATIVMISEDSARSNAVDWEIRESYRQGKKVIGVRVHSDRNESIPPALLEHNAPVINWQLKEIKRLLSER